MAGYHSKTFVIFIVLFHLTIVVYSQTSTSSATSAPTNGGTTVARQTTLAGSSSSTDDPAYDLANTTGNDISAESVDNCTLQYSAEAIEQFMELLDKQEEAIFVYFKLNFGMEFESDMAYLSENTTDVIDPLTWVWSKGGRGELLLSSPFDFIHLSLGTMKPGVYSMTLDLMDDTACLSDDTSDVKKMKSIAKTLLDLTEKAANELDQEPIACRDLEEEEDEDEETSICLEKQLGPDQFDVVGVYAFPSVSYTILQGSTVYECWTANGDNVPKSNPVTTQSWLHWLLAGGILLALFSPLALDFFIRKHPPFKDHRNLNERFMLVTDPIPVGFKYVLFFWEENIPWFHFARWVVLILVFGFIQYIPLLVAFCMDSDGLAKRMAAVYRVGLVDQTKDVGLHVFINLFYFVFSLVLLGIYVSPKGHKFLLSYLRERDTKGEEEDEQQVGEEKAINDAEDDRTNGNLDPENGGKTKTTSIKDQEEENIAFRKFVVLEMPESLWTPDTVLPNARAFLFIMAFRVKMMFDPNLWKFCVEWLWDMTSFCGSPNSDSSNDDSSSTQNNSRLILRGLLFVIIFPFYLIFFVFLLCFNSLPLLYCLMRSFQTVSNEVRISEILFFLNILVIAVAWFCKFVGIFTYIAEIIGYTFVGFVANAEIVGPICLVVVVFIGYFVNAATDFYDVYCKLFRETVEAAEDVDKELEDLVKDDTDTGMTANELKEGVLYRKKLKPARSFSWVKGQKVAKGEERIEMTVASQESATPGTVDIAPTDTPPNSLAGSVADQPNTSLLSKQHQEVLRLVSKPGFGSLVTYNKKGTPAIESRLFWLVVEKYCPVRGRAAAAFVQLVTLAVIIAFGMTILFIVDGFRDLPATVEFFGSVIVAGVIPIFLVAMRSPESQECYDEAMKRQLRVDVRAYALFSEFESMAL